MDEKEELLYLRQQVKKLKQENRELNSRLTLMETSKKETEENLYRIKHSFAWKLSKPLRLARVGIAKLECYRTPKRIMERADYKKRLKRAYSLLGTDSFPSEEERKRQESVKYEQKITFSVLVPLYNTPEKFLTDMIDSVKYQTYPDWELCLADGSDAEHAYVGDICRKYAEADPRIRYEKLEKNEGISGNTNECYKMATGDYIGLFDHDDILHPCAFFEYRKAIDEKNADYVYCDEATFMGDSINNMDTLHFKPDYALDTLRANNYICHFSLFKRSLLAETQLFRTEFDGSQDHDMILRLTSLAKHVVHVPKILYYWRAHAGSVAKDINAKFYAVDAAKRAVDAHLNTYGIYDTTITSTRAFETIFRLQYDITTTGKVSVILPARGGDVSFKDTIEALKKTDDEIDELILVSDGSAEDVVMLQKEYETDPFIKVMNIAKGSHLPAFYNAGAKIAKGEFLLFLKPGIRPTTADYIEELLMYVQRDDIGAAGGKCLFDDKTVEHAGIVLGLGDQGCAGHVHYKCYYTHIGYMGRLCYAQNMTAVSGASMMVKKKDFEEAGGFEEKLFDEHYYDVDLCLKLRALGKLNVFTPFAESFYNEIPMAPVNDSEEAKEAFEKESEAFRNRWKAEIEAGDPYYNENFSLKYLDYTLKIVRD
ncbi:MAG: glycosyltransferase [Lachnospiraceae bacterium]|nr:glycosyltransferase [Lachnospiraceae bacterium]